MTARSCIPTSHATWVVRHAAGAQKAIVEVWAGCNDGVRLAMKTAWFACQSMHVINRRCRAKGALR